MKYIMKNWAVYLLFTSFIISCSAPKASILEKNSNEFLVSIEKKATSPMDIVDIQLSDGNNWASGSFQYIDKVGSGDVILNDAMSTGAAFLSLQFDNTKYQRRAKVSLISIVYVLSVPLGT